MESKKRIRRKDYDNPKVRKHVTLTPEAVEKINAFSAENNVSFSAAVETLSLLGLNNNDVMALLPVLTSALHKSANSSFNRLAKLSAMAAIEAGMTREMTSSILQQLLFSQYSRHGAEMEEKLRVDRTHPSKLLRNKILGIARRRAVKRLKSPLEQIDEILNAGEPAPDE